MVEMVMNEVDPGADLVLAMGPSHIVGSRETPVIAVGWIPSLRIANRCVTGNDKRRETAAAKIGTVICARNAQDIRPDILSKIRSLAILAHAGKTYVTVDDESG